jgi:hypothetical protein
MRVAICFALVVAPLAVIAQEKPEKTDPSKVEVEVTGCVRGSTLTETNLRVGGASDEQPSRRWRLRTSKALRNQLKELAGKELTVVGATKSAESMTTAGKRIGKMNIYIGGDSSKTARDPLPDLPTIDVASFEPTGEVCR